VKLDGNLSVGVVTKEEVKPGWKTRGCFYNGNLTNGSAALIVSFGAKHVAAGDTVGVLTEYTTTTTTASEEEGGMTATDIYLYHNDNCLGKAFSLPPSCTAKTRRHPALHVSGSAVLDLVLPRELPVEKERAVTSFGSDDDDKYGGEWKLVKVYVGPELGEYPLPPQQGSAPFVIKLQKRSQTEYGFSMKIVNTISSSITWTGETLEEGGFDVISFPSAFASTRMMGPPDLMKLENTLTKHLPSLNKMLVSDDETKSLLLNGPTLELHCEPYVKTFEPLTKY
jgi:hypothetical protein